MADPSSDREANAGGRPAAPTRVASVRTRIESRPYRQPFGISSGVTADLLTVLVEVTDTRGDVGFGEATPMTAYTGEMPDGVCAAVDHLGEVLLGLPVADIVAAHQVMDAALRGQHVAKAGLDIALHDLLARSLGVPVHTLLGGQIRDRVSLAWVVGLGKVDDVVREAVEYAQRGFSHIKVKGGEEPDRDVALATELRAALRDDVEISFDANEGYERSTALATLARLQEAGVCLVEQPLPAWDLTGMARLTHELHMRVMADESVQSLHDALAVVRCHAADVINIKILKVGGLYRALQVGAVAAAAGLAVKVGSMPELDLATLAATHLAAALPHATVPADLVGPLMVVGDSPGAGPVFGAVRDGSVSLPWVPGLGVPAASPGDVLAPAADQS